MYREIGVQNELASPAPHTDVDPFSVDYIQNPYPHHDELRKAPVVHLRAYDVLAVGRFEQVQAILADYNTFISGAGVGISNLKTEKPWRTPSLLLETDPPDHTKNRAIISRALSPASLRSLRERFEAKADDLVASCIAAGEFDAIPNLAEMFPMRAFADAVGVPQDGRHNLVAYGNMVFNTMGPRNEMFEDAMRNATEVIGWIGNACLRSSLTKDGLGAQIYTAADDGTISEAEAGLIVRSFLSAGIDTTTNAIANALVCFADHPEQWNMVRAKPDLMRSAFEEVMRFESPFQTFFRTASRSAEIAGIPVVENQKIMLSMGAANRDPARWERADAFDISRKATGHVGFGAGIHGCVGQMIARLEVEVLFKALAKQVSAIELSGTPVPLIHNTLRGYQKLPLRLHG